MKISSKKAKGRRFQQWVAQKISNITGIECGKDCLIESREMGQSGSDIKLYGIAKEKFPFNIECKNQQNWSIPAWIDQAKNNQNEGTNWLLFIKKNHYEPIIIMDAEAFFNLYKKYLNLL